MGYDCSEQIDGNIHQSIPFASTEADMVHDLGILRGAATPGPDMLQSGFTPGLVSPAPRSQQIEFGFQDELIIGVRCFKVIDRNSSWNKP